MEDRQAREEATTAVAANDGRESRERNNARGAATERDARVVPNWKRAHQCWTKLRSYCSLK